MVVSFSLLGLEAGENVRLARSVFRVKGVDSAGWPVADDEKMRRPRTSWDSQSRVPSIPLGVSQSSGATSGGRLCLSSVEMISKVVQFYTVQIIWLHLELCGFLCLDGGDQAGRPYS